MEKVLNEVTQNLDQLLGDDWFIYNTESGFEVYFCRSCKFRKDSSVDVTLREYSNIPEKIDFFEPHMADSVSYYTLINSYDPTPRTEDEIHEYLVQFYAKDDILKIEIRFDELWSKEKIKSIQAKNDALKKAILKSPLYHSNEEIFSDYRFWLPKDNWRKRTKDFDYYFEQLPYKSLLYDYSIFIDSNRPFYFAGVMFPNPEQSDFYNREENFIEKDKNRTLRIIALALGIHDFTIL